MSTTNNQVATLSWEGGEAFTVLDACFEVEGADGTPVRFFANRKYLAAIAPSLAALFGTSDGKIATATITDVDPVTFRCLLYCVHGGDVREEERMAHSRIIDAAEKYGVVHLIYASLLKSTKIHEIKLEDAIDAMNALLFANTYNLPDLGELAVDFIQRNEEKFREFNLNPSPLISSLRSFNELCGHAPAVRAPAPVPTFGAEPASAAFGRPAAAPAPLFGDAPDAPVPAPAVRAPAPPPAFGFGAAPAPATGGYIQRNGRVVWDTRK